MPDRGVKIARGLGRSYDKLRSVFLSDVCLKILSGDQNSYTVEASYDSHWYLDRQEYTEPVTGKKYIVLRIADAERCRLEKLRNMTAIQVGNAQIGWERFKTAAKPTFLPGSVPVYQLKLTPTGERV